MILQPSDIPQYATQHVCLVLLSSVLEPNVFCFSDTPHSISLNHLHDIRNSLAARRLLQQMIREFGSNHIGTCSSKIKRN